MVLSFFQILKLQTQKNLLKTFRIRKVPLNLIHRPTPNPAVLVPRRNLRQNLRRYHLMSKRKTRNQNSEKPEVILQDRVKEVHRSENDRPDVVDYFQKNTLVPQMWQLFNHLWHILCFHICIRIRHQHLAFRIPWVTCCFPEVPLCHKVCKCHFWLPQDTPI